MSRLPKTYLTPEQYLENRAQGRVQERIAPGRDARHGGARLEDSLGLQSVGCHLALADVYEKINFAAAEPAAG
jgi:hypothetical protein